MGLVVAIMAIVLSATHPVGAASAAVYGPGTIQGFAHDADGNAAVGGEVVLTNLTDGMETTATVDRNGGFFFFEVSSGSYSITLNSGSGTLERDFIFIQKPGAGMTISLRLWESDGTDPAATGSFQIRRTNPNLMGQPALQPGN